MKAGTTLEKQNASFKMASPTTSVAMANVGVFAGPLFCCPAAPIDKRD